MKPGKNGASATGSNGQGGFYHSLRRLVGRAVEARRLRLAAQSTATDLARLPDTVRQDIDWPPKAKRKQH